ncbi:hypothetical protein ACEPPN_007223 [Leptodophora sp. 'Broadleaf-Isolate-01']
MSNQGYYNQGPPQQQYPPQAYQQGGYPQQGFPPQQAGYQQGPPMQQQAAHVVEDVSVSVSLHCAAAVSAKRAAKLALIVPSAAKDAVKHETNYTTPNTTTRS